MTQTFQEWVSKNRKRGVSAQDLKDGFFQRYGVKLEDQDANADYDAFRTDFEAKQFVGPQLPQTPEKPPQVVAPTPTPEKPTQAVVERDTGSLRAAPKDTFEGEGFLKAGARYLLPKAFGIEEAVLGPDPDTLAQYDKARTQAEIAKFRTIKPDEYQFDPRQVARLPGMVAGAAVETAKLPLELAAQIPEAALRAAQLVTPFADIPESQARQLGAEEYRKDIAKGLTKAGEVVTKGAEAVTEGAMKVAQQVTPFADMPDSQARQLAPRVPQITPEDITPKVTQEVVGRYLGEDPDEELRLQSKDIYTLMQEDVEEVLAGLTQATFTDIIPLLPSKERKDLTGYFKEGFERGEQLPGFMAAGGAIGAKALGEIFQGNFQKGIRTFYERPATFLLTIAPIVGKLPPAARSTLLKIYVNPTYAPYLTSKLGAKGFARVVDTLRRAEPGTTAADVGAVAGKAVEPIAKRTAGVRTKLAQTFVDPLRQLTPEETAVAERVYEESRATREKARTATEKIAEEAGEPDVTARTQGAMVKEGIVEEGVKTEIDASSKINQETIETQRKLMEKRFGKDFLERGADAEAQLAEGQRLLETAEKPEATLAELQAADLFETSHKARLEKEVREYRDALTETREEAKQIIRKKYGDAAFREPRFKKLSREATEFAEQGTRPATITREGQLVYERLEPRQLEATPELLEQSGVSSADLARTSTFVDELLSRKDLKTVEERKTWVDTNIPDELRNNTPIYNAIQRIAETPLSDLIEQKQIVKRQIPERIYDEIKESFRPSYPLQAGRRFAYQLSSGIKRIVSEGAADIIEQNTMVFLRDGKIRTGFVNYLVDKYGTRLTRESKTVVKNKLDRVLSERSRESQYRPIEISELGERGFSEREIRQELATYLGESGFKGADVLKQAIKDRVLFDVRNAAFKESIANNLAYETAGLIRDGATGKITGRLDTAQAVGKDIMSRKNEVGSLPAAVSFIESGAQTFDAVIAEVAKVSELDAKTLNTYVKASPELARVIGYDTYVNPYFNSSFTSIIKAFDTIGKVELGFNYIISEAKRGFTSRNLSSAKNNFIANVLLYSLYYGPYEGFKATLMSPRALSRMAYRDVFGTTERTFGGKLADTVGFSDPLGEGNFDAFNRFVNKKPNGRQERVMFDAMRESGLIDNTNISNEVSLLKKGNFFTDVITDPLARKGVPAAQQVSTAIKKINVAQDAAYTFGDNYFKFLAARTEILHGYAALEALEVSTSRNPIYMTVRLGERLGIRIMKDTNGRLRRITKMPNQTESGRAAAIPLTEAEVARILTKGGSRLALEKFVDYERIPGFLAWLRSAAPGGIVSLYSTWAYKMMDAPGKRGIVSHFMQNENIIGKTNSETLQRLDNQIRSQRGMNRTVAAGVARTQIDEEQDGDVRRMLAYNPRGLQLITYSTSNLDPSTLIYRDANATNFMAGSEAVARLLVGGGLIAYELMKDGFENIVGPVETKEQLQKVMTPQEYKLSQDVRKLSLKFKGGQLITPKDVLVIANFAGNPVFDFFDMVVESDNNPYIDLGNYVMKTGQSIIFGGTGKYMMDKAFVAAAGRDYIRKGGDAFTRVLFSNVYKRSQNYSYNSEQIENQKTLAREAANMVLGTAYRYAFVHKRIGNKDKGKFARWVDDYKRNLDASLVRAQKLRLQSLAAAGYPDDDPAMKEVIRRFTILKTAVNEEVGNFKLRVFNAIDRSGFYENLEKTK